MPQNTNLNVSPYFDDFNESNKYQRVLFKPGTPIQARELTTLQTILQNQIEKFGKHFFKEGSVVIPGQISYDSEYFCVQIDETHLGIPVSLYLDELVGKKIRGSISGVTAKVESYITNQESEKKNYTLYIKYQSSSDIDFTQTKFIDGENLIALDNIFYGISSIQTGSSLATTIVTNSTATGSCVKIAEGVYFVRGFFVNVSSQTVILDQYANSPSYRVGLLIKEELAVASNNYSDLFDNAQGFSNFAAPGADRLKIELFLVKKSITDFNDEDFIELLRIEDGIVKKFVNESNYNLIADELAKRTYDESGDYYIRPFSISIKETLNNRIGNNGIFYEDQRTKQGNIPSDNLGCLVVSPGKAVVRGYSVETIGTTNIDFVKSREVDTLQNQFVPFNLGRQIEVNNVYGSIPVGFTTNSQILFYDSRTSTSGISSGTKIGTARIYDFKLKNSEYVNKATKFECSLYDIQTYTTLTLNASLTLTAPVYVEGLESSASGYLAENVTNSNIINLYEVSGSFKSNELIKISGFDYNRTITSVRDYNLSDVHQIVGLNTTTGIGSFTADPILSNVTLLSDPSTQFTITSSGTLTSSNFLFFDKLSVGDIVSYSIQGNTTPTYNKVSSISTQDRKVTLSPTTTVSGICSGILPTSTITVNDLRKVSLEVKNQNDAFLYAKVGQNNISNLNLQNSSIIVKKSYTVSISSNGFTGVLETDQNLTLEPFDEEDYNLTYVSDGSVESLTSQKVSVLNRTITLSNLSKNGSAVLTVTYRKANLKTKKKSFNRCSSLIVDGSSFVSSGTNVSIGNTTLNDGLTYTQIYGLRVHDKVISLNTCDVVNILGVYESSTSSDPILPRVYFNSLTSSINNFIKGERLIGETSGAVASVVSNDGINSLEIVYLNENKFLISESIISDETKISGIVGSLLSGDKNIKNNFILDNGQRPDFYDYSRLIRKKEFIEPTRRIKIIFDHYTISSSDDGDFVSVDSYGFERYAKNVPSINGIRNTDIIDLRPRVSNYIKTTSSRSPFESSSRVFSNLNNSSNFIFSKDKTLFFSYSYYLPRIDKLFLTKDGSFILNKGVSSSAPKAPNPIDSALEIATIFYPPYLYNINDVKVSLATHKRYTMKDISRLDNRLSNVEYYTSLSLLETETKNLVIRDPKTNLDRFKCGFFVDNFKSALLGDISNPSYRSSIDTSLGVLRPQSYSTSIDLLLGSSGVTDISTPLNLDLRYVTDLGSSNVTRSGDLVMLNYKDVLYTQNKFATRSENVNPFNTPSWIGTIELNPSSDTWIEPRRSSRTVDIEGNYSSTIEQLAVDTNTGFSPIDWNAWETNWTGTSSVEGPTIARIQGATSLISDTTTSEGFIDTRTQVFQDSFTDFRNLTTTRTGTQSRSGIQFGVTESFDTTLLGDRVVSRSIITIMRSRNIELVARRLKPLSRFYAFFDNVSMTEYVIPKLIEINMQSGTFVAGETVTGFVSGFGGPLRTISFRLATQNHRYGPYNTPIEVYTNNPYNINFALSSEYSSTTTVLNVDTASLEVQSDSRFFGSIVKNMQLVGQTSNAIATVSDVRLISDSAGTFIGSLFIPDPTLPSTPVFQTGTKTLVLTTSVSNSEIPGNSGSSAETNFTSSGTIDNVESTTLRIRNADIERLERFELNSDPVIDTDTRLITVPTSTNRSIVTRTERPRPPASPPPMRWVDPLAQTFEVNDRNGVYITKCDIFFRTKDPGSIPITLQIRTSQLGLPTQEVLPFSEVILEPSKINVSDDATVPTTFTFPSPVFLESANAYAIVLISNSDSYNVWISRMTEVDVSTQNKPETERIIVSQQPTLGSLFKSQNGATWDASQLEDLKFNLYRAEFTSNIGSIKFYNPDLGVGNRQIVSLRSNPITAYSKKILVGLAGTLTPSDITNLKPGVTITQENYPNFSGKFVSFAGSVGIGSTLHITNTGVAYTSNTTYSNISVQTITGRGSGAKINLTTKDGVAIAATVVSGGFGYATGDTLTVSPSLTGGFGKNLILTIPNTVGIITTYNSLIIDNVQDNIDTGQTNNRISYVNSSGTISISTNGLVNYSETISDGLHMKVSHNSHSMYGSNNKVILYNIESDIKPEKLIFSYNQSSTADIRVSAVGVFTAFEGLPVNPNNPGYVKINNEIIKYTEVDVATNSLKNITRSIDNDDSMESTLSSNGYHDAESLVFKYEFNGISLRRINRTHSLSDTDLNKYPIGIDDYHIKILTDERGTDRKNTQPILHFKESKTGGLYDGNYLSSVNSVVGPKATQNISFDILKPVVQYMLPDTTNVQAKIRTTSGTSPDGSQISFQESGYIPISLNSNNVFDSPRLIASKVNEVNNIPSTLGNKSFAMELTLSTQDTKVSPIIDLDRVSIITSMNRINKPISNYVTDLRINSLFNDPNAAIYLSKIIGMNKSANSLKVYFDAYRDYSNEIIVLYRLLRSDSSENSPLFDLFPGYTNLDSDGNVINIGNNSGLPDTFVPPSSSSNDLRSYEYTANNLSLFDAFQIKIVMTGTNHAIVPKIKDLRGIATYS